MARDADVPQIYRVGASPNTRVALSMKNRIYSKPYGLQNPSPKQVGIVSTFDYSEGRSVDPVRAVGFGDRVVELVPGVTEPMSITLNRTLMYTSGIVQELGYRGGVDGLVRSLRHHRWPFDLSSELVFSELVTSKDESQIGVKVNATITGTDGESHYAMVTLFEACWISNYSVSFPSDSAIVMEDCTVMATDVVDGTSNYANGPDDYGDFMNSGNDPILQEGSGSRIFTVP